MEAGCKDDGLGGAGAPVEVPDGLGEKADRGSLGNLWRRAPTPGVRGDGDESDILRAQLTSRAFTRQAEFIDRASAQTTVAVLIQK